jgi:gluconokinase
VTRVLALDVGTSSVRVRVFDEAVEEGEVARREYPGEDDPDRLVELVREAVGGALRSGAVDAAGTSCFGHSLLPLDADGRPLTQVLGWRDTRSADAAGRLARRLDAQAVHARTGCHVHTSYWPAKLAWLAEEQPDVFRAARRFVSFPEYLYSRLLHAAETPMSISVASATGLLNLHTRAWDEELLATLDLDEALLPRVADEAVGDWFLATHDGACANLGAGAVSRERAALTIGTSGAYRTVYETDAPMPRPGLFLFRVDGSRVVEGGALSDGGNVYRWLGETFSDPGGSLADRDPASHGLTFVTLLGGERSPGWHQHAKGVIHGLTFATTALDIRQAALEGVAFRFADVAELMPEIEEIVATGGALLKDEDWCQIVADALGRSITASAVKEASLRGAAVLTLERLGVTAPAPPLGRTYHPREEHAAAYLAARERQRELYRVATGDETS